MNVLADLIVVLIVILCAFIGYRKGVIFTLFNLFGGLISYLTASIFSRSLGSFISESCLKPIFRSFLSGKIAEFLTEQTASFDVDQSLSSIGAILERFGLDQSQLLSSIDISNQDPEKLIRSAIDSAITPVVDSLGYFLAFSILFFAVFFVFKFIVKFFDLISKLPMLNATNRILGLVFGLCFGAVISLAVSCLLVSLEPFFQSNKNELLSEFSLKQTYLIRFFIKVFNIKPLF